MSLKLGEEVPARLFVVLVVGGVEVGVSSCPRQGALFEFHPGCSLVSHVSEHFRRPVDFGKGEMCARCPHLDGPLVQLQCLPMISSTVIACLEVEIEYRGQRVELEGLLHLREGGLVHGPGGVRTHYGFESSRST